MRSCSQAAAPEAWNNLLPDWFMGSASWMGAQKKDPTGQNFDPQAESNEYPVHEVRLDAYFISKYELTQGQWARIVRERSRPSLNLAGFTPVGSPPFSRATFVSGTRLANHAVGLHVPADRGVRTEWSQLRIGLDQRRQIVVMQFVAPMLVGPILERQLFHQRRSQ